MSLKPVDPLIPYTSRRFREYWIEPWGNKWTVQYIEPWDILRRRVDSAHFFKFTARLRVKYMMWVERRGYERALREDELAKRRWPRIECYRHPEDS